jgi:hypothetical protein
LVAIDPLSGSKIKGTGSKSSPEKVARQNVTSVVANPAMTEPAALTFERICAGETLAYFLVSILKVGNSLVLRYLRIRRKYLNVSRSGLILLC